MDTEKTFPKITRSRRDMLKKVGISSAFIVPTIASFKISELAVAASSTQLPGTPSDDY